MLNEELIARRPRGRKGLPEWYAEVFEAQRAQGLSHAQVAGQVGTTTTNIYYWRRRLRSLGLGAAGAEKPTGAQLLQVRLSSAEEPAAAEDGFEVHLSGGRAVTVPSSFDADALGRLVRTLESC